MLAEEGTFDLPGVGQWLPVSSEALSVAREPVASVAVHFNPKSPLSLSVLKTQRGASPDMEPSCPWKEPSLTSKSQWPPPHLSAHPLLVIAVQDTRPGHELRATLSSERNSRGVSATLLL